MKKLVALIGAVAMGFGLFANESVSFSTSFEAGEAGVEGATFTPGTGWEWSGDPLALGAYADDAYEYGTGDLARRFDGDNTQYLQLETGDKMLTRDLGAGNTTVDQLVQFTGYDAPLTEFAADAKIAVWMLGTETQDDTPGETNLYVTCGAEKDALKLVAPAGTVWQTEKWYRLTVKSLGADATGREQFNIYIDGQLLSSVGQDTQTVFPSMAENVPVTKMKIQGIGAIDDLMIDADGPLFTQSVEFTVELPANVASATVTGAEQTATGWKAKTGAAIAITYTAADGYLFNNKQNTITVNTTAAKGVIAATDDVKSATEAKAKIGTVYYLTLAEALNAATDGQTVTLLADTAADAVVVKANTTLDLNKKKVQTTAVVNNGTIIIYCDELAQLLIANVNGNYIAGERITDGATFDFPAATTISIVANDPATSAGSTITVTSEGVVSYGAGVAAKKTMIFNVAGLAFAGNVCRGSRVDTAVTVNGPASLVANLNVGVDDDPTKIDYVTYPDGKAIVTFNGAVTAQNDAKIVLAASGVVKSANEIDELFAEPAAGNKIVKTANGDGTFTYTVGKRGLTVILANVGGKASVTVDQEGEIEAGTKITGTITDVASGYAAYVFVDDVRVAVDQDGKFEGVANNSGKVTVAYAKDTSWIVESFVRNYFKSGITSEGCQCAAYDAQNGKAFFSCSPSAGSTDVVEYDYAALANGFGERIAEEHYAGKGTLEGAMWARSFGVANGYMISCNRGAAAPGKLQVRYYLDADGKPVKYESTSAESIQLKDAEGQDLNYTLYPVAVNKAGTNVYGSDGSKLYKFAVGVDATTKKVTSLTLVNAWRINWRPSGMTVANIGGKEIVYGKGCESEGAFGLMVVDTSLDDTEDAMVAKYLDADVGGDGDQEAFGLAVSGIAEGLPHITMVGPMQGKVFALTADGLDLAGKDPLWTVRFAEIGIKVGTNLRYGIVVPDDESRLMLGLNDGGLAVAVLERKPENLIVRGRVGEAQDDDRTIKFGEAASETFTAPKGYEITAVTVNGTPVEDFVAADSYTYEADTLNEYVLVKMTVAEKAAPWSDVEKGEIEGITEENKAAVEVQLDAIKAALGEGADEAAVGGWLTKVYGNQKVPAADVVAAKNIAISVKYDLPLMANDPEIEVAKDEAVADGFTFTIKDGEKDVSVAVARVEEIVKYSDTVDGTFAKNTEKIAVTPADTVIKANFRKPNNEAQGFMKAELK